MKSALNTIEEAFRAVKRGEVIIVVDDEDRENEGDFVIATCNAIPEAINFMTIHGRGLICVSVTVDHCKELSLPLMVQHNTAEYETNFTVSVDLIGYGCTTGTSVTDRSKTIVSLYSVGK